MNLSTWTPTFAAASKPGFIQQLVDTWLKDGNWKLFVQGIKGTLKMTVVAVVIGIAIGVAVGIIKYLHHTSGRLKLLNKICNLYTTVIRGTPIMVQLLITNYVIFANVHILSRLAIASLAFGFNSGAYVSEIIRGGLLAVHKGQVETGRSLGLSEGQTMRLIVLPQAVRNILPALFNEIIAMVKETSIAGTIGVLDITQAGDGIRAASLSNSALWIMALIYLLIVLVLTQIQGVIEKRMTLHD